MLLMNLVSENHSNCDEHMSIVLFLYKITYKVIIGYTPYQLVYGLHWRQQYMLCHFSIEDHGM